MNLAEFDTRSFHAPTCPTFVANLPSEVMDGVVDKDNDDAKCPVCLVDIEIGTTCKRLPCGHRFHDQCIRTWLASKRSCPVCRAELPAAPSGDGTGGGARAASGYGFDGSAI